MSDLQLQRVLHYLAEVQKAGAAGPAVMPALFQVAPASLHPALRRSLEGGVPLSRSLGEAGVIDAAERALLEAGEHAGRVPEVLQSLSERVQERRKTRNAFLVALAYPAVLVVLAGFLLTAPIVVTQGVGAWLSVAIWPLVVIGVAALIGLVIFPRLPQDSPARTAPVRWVSALPLLGRGVNRLGLGAVCDLLGQLLAAGLPMTLALPAAFKAWPALAPHEPKALQSIASGSTLSDALERTGVIPSRLLGPIGIAEQSGTLDTTLQVLGAEETASGRRFHLAVALAAGVLAFALVAIAIGASVIGGAQSYYEQIERITDES